MTAFQGDERVSRKSTAYNQTGQSYFQQLSAYNHMSAHLRRVLLAPRVVDSRNKRYMRDRRLSCSRDSSNRSKSLDKLRTQEDIIDGLAYDTKHHPLDVLRRSLECSPECRRKVKRVVEICTGCCNDWCARSRAGFMSSAIEQRMAINSEADGAICRCLRSQSCKPSSATGLKRGSKKATRLSGSSRRVVDQSEWKKNHKSRTTKAASSRGNVEDVEPSYSYASSFESSSANSSAPGSPILKKSESIRGSRAESPIAELDRLDRRRNTFSETAERAEEAKYAKFIYDITQEIMINGLYTDDELNTIFKKHIDVNSDTLDRKKMQSEIYQLKMSLNVPERSDEEEDSDNERYMDSGKFANLSFAKPRTSPKILDDNQENFRSNQPSIRFGENRKPKNAQEKNTACLVDQNPELLITERDVLLTLMEMKIDPSQIQRICKSLQNKSRETALSQTVQVDAETYYPRKRQDRANSPINSGTENRNIDFNHPYKNRMVPVAAGGSRKTKLCQCRCKDASTNVYISEESQMELQPEPAIQTTLHDSHQEDKIRMASRSDTLDGVSDLSLAKRSIMKPESRKIYEVPEISDIEGKEGKTSHEYLLNSQRISPESSRALLRFASVKSGEKRSEKFGELEEREIMEKINVRRSSSSSQTENRTKDNSYERSREQSEEEEQENTSKKNLQKSASTIQAENGSDDDSSVKSTESQSEEKEREKISLINMKRKDDSTSALKMKRKRETKDKSLGKIDNALKINEENIESTKMHSQSLEFNENPDITFISHSEFMKNLGTDDANSLPDISERTEGITEDIETGNISDEIRTIGSEVTSQRSQIEDVTDNDLGNLSEQIFEINLESVDKKSSIILENIDETKVPSVTKINDAAETQNSMQKVSEINEDFEDNISENSEDSNDDSDENKQVVSANLKPLSSSVLLPKVSSSSLNPHDNKVEGIAAEETILSPELTPRISLNLENKNEKSDEKILENTESNFHAESPKNSGEFDERYSLKVEKKVEDEGKNVNDEEKSDDTYSIETELDQPEILNSTSEVHIEEKIENKKKHTFSGLKNSKADDQNEENHESQEIGEQSKGSSTTIHEIPKNRMGISRTQTDSIDAAKNLEEEIDDSEKQKEKKSVGSRDVKNVV